jgi:hypothetical protein
MWAKRNAYSILVGKPEGKKPQMWAKRNAYTILVGKPEGKKPRHRRLDNIKMDLRRIEWSEMDWIDMVRDMVQ